LDEAFGLFTSTLRAGESVDLITAYANPRFTWRSVEELRHLKNVVAKTQENLRPLVHPIRDISRRLGSEQIQQLVADYEAGIHTPELVKKYTLSKTSVLKILRDNHVAIRRQSMTPEQIGQAMQLYEDGYSLSATAQEIEMPKQSVRNALLKAGVKMRVSRGSTAN
jgi:hypothetical protein